MKQALKAASDPGIQYDIEEASLPQFGVSAHLWIRPELRPEVLVQQARDQLLARFSFARQPFGRRIQANEIVALLQKLHGVVGVELQSVPMDDVPLPPLPQAGGGKRPRPIPLWTIDPDRITLTAREVI